MDYTKQPLAFQLRKAARYTRLYGPRRTVVKIRGQYHMQSRRFGLPTRTKTDPLAHVGILGCGNFAYSNVAYYLRKNFGHVLRAAMDVDLSRAESLTRAYGGHYATDDASRVIDDPRIDLIFIASNHASHAEYAIQALDAGKSVHIEKPHVVSDDQLIRLCRAMQRAPGRVRLGFGRPDSKLGLEVRRLLSGQEGSAMFNWFIAGHEIPPGHWYFSESEGGRVLGNLCHWTDFVFQMAPAEQRFPIEIRPTRASNSESDLAVSYVFGDGTVAAITFSAKGHTFEGVRERFAAHRGDLLLSLSDFKELTADIVERRERVRLRYRDHGHEDAIRRSYGMSERAAAQSQGSSIAYVWETAQLFLKTREALRQDAAMRVGPFDPGVLARSGAGARVLDPSDEA